MYISYHFKFLYKSVIDQKDTNDIDISNYYDFFHAPQSNKQSIPVVP